LTFCSFSCRGLVYLHTLSYTTLFRSNGRFGHTVAACARRAPVAALVRCRLSCHLPDWLPLHAAPRAQGARGDAGPGSGPGRASGESGPAPPRIAATRRPPMTEPAISFVGIWTVIIAAVVFFYVLLDGFDLGIGILHGFAPDATD